MVLIVFGYAYFYNAYNWNHISRFDAIFSFVERDTPDQLSFRIDHFLLSPLMGRNTGDWARNEEQGAHYYSNKAPGIMLLGVPVYALLYTGESLLGAVPESQSWTRINTYLLNTILSVVPAAWAALLFLRLARRNLGLLDREAMALTLLLFFGTLVFPYATQLWGHVTAAAFLIAALYFLLGDSNGSAAWSGCFVGMAVLSEYSAAIPLLGMLGLLAIGGQRSRFAAFVIGGLPAFAVHFIYHRALFGSGFALASFYNNPKFLDAEKVGGIFAGIETEAIFGLSFSAHHGLFFFSPFLLLIVPSVLLVVAPSGPSQREREVGPRSGPDSQLLFLSLFTIGGFALMNMSFNGWHGGFCLGPRYLIPSVPFYAVLLAPIVIALRGKTRLGIGLLVLLGSLSIANMSLLAIRAPSTTFLEENQSNPLMGYYRDLLSGELRGQRLSPLRLDGDWIVEGKVTPQRNGSLDLAGGSDKMSGAWPRAESFLRMKKPESSHFVMGWQGDLGLRVNGADVSTPHHEGHAVETISVKLASGENAISVSLQDSDEGRFSFFALASQARPRLPRASRDAPIHSRSGSNLGKQLGLEGVASLVPFFLGMALIAVLLIRALPPRGAEGP